MAALSTERMLAEEADAIRGGDSRMAGALAPELKEHRTRTERVRESADERDGRDRPPAEVDQRKAFYRSLNRLNRAALCLSGGGIRSATFCLGIIQALAAYDVTPLQARPEEPQPAEQTGITPQNSLLGRFHYLSTVSGGGYVGSWLSSWRQRDIFTNILSNLTGRPSGPDVEPPEISWLRAYSNYLTPRVGIGSADTWAAAAIIIRNLVLNWLVIIPVACLVLLALKLLAACSVWLARNGDSARFGDTVKGWPILLTLAVGIICLIVAQAFTTSHRPPRRTAAPNGDETGSAASQEKCRLCRRILKAQKCFLCRQANSDERCFLLGDFVWAVVSAITVTIFFTSHYFVSWVDALQKALNKPATANGLIPEIVNSFGLTAGFAVTVLTAVAGFLVYSAGWFAGGRRGRDWGGDYGGWALSGLIYGALVGFGAYLFSLLGPDVSIDVSTVHVRLASLLLAIIFGVPWVLMAQLSADNIFGGLVSYEALSDSDREWLGRAAGWIAAFAIAWAIVAFLVFAAGYFVQAVEGWTRDIVTAAGGVTGVVSGIATALLGKSPKTPAQPGSGDQDWSAIASNIWLAIAGPAFAAILVVALSIALDALLLHGSLIDILQSGSLSTHAILAWLGIGFVVLGFVAWVASWCVNINRFSLHALYRNRLIRAYLGASRQERHPDRFTGFDIKDNVRMHELWPPKSDPGHLFHVVNIALNVVSAERLAWQERKAESFTVSPSHCGSAYLGFRSSEEYGDSLTRHTAEHGIALGTAMAISGAAVSSNMGYHSSPSLALLLTLFNVRLGWWLGNPGPAGDRHNAYRREGPRFSVLPLLFEAFGQTTDDRPYVYLSDGGHFENLGLYEMVRRRCRLIVVVDAGCDPDFAFEDLGNAVRKIYIDLGVRIKFTGLEQLRNRPKEDDPAPEQIPYCAIGTIDYEDADGAEAGCDNGCVIYIKPAYHGTEGAAIRSYANAHKSFPHETTVDQWFTESQFESYRALGLDIAKHCLGDADVHGILHQFLRHAD